MYGNPVTTDSSYVNTPFDNEYIFSINSNNT